MDDAVASLLDFVAQLHARHDHPATPAEFATALGIRVLAGDEDSANAGPPALITYNRAYGLRRRFTLWHEVAHILMAWHGLEAELEGQFDEDAPRHLEAVANLTAGLLAIPRPLMREAVGQHGVTPAAVLHLKEHSRMSEGVALRRMVYDDPEASRAAAVITGPYVADVARLNCWLPFWRYDRVPPLALPHAHTHAIHGRRILAVWDGQSHG